MITDPVPGAADAPPAVVQIDWNAYRQQCEAAHALTDQQVLAAINEFSTQMRSYMVAAGIPTGDRTSDYAVADIPSPPLPNGFTPTAAMVADIGDNGAAQVAALPAAAPAAPAAAAPANAAAAAPVAPAAAPAAVPAAQPVALVETQVQSFVPLQGCSSYTTFGCHARVVSDAQCGPLVSSDMLKVAFRMVVLSNWVYTHDKDTGIIRDLPSFPYNPPNLPTEILLFGGVTPESLPLVGRDNGNWVIVADNQRQNLIAVFRGTWSSADAATDASGANIKQSFFEMMAVLAAVPLRIGDHFFGNIHGGFAALWSQLGVAKKLAMIRQGNPKYANYKVTFAGHSLGGAQALLAAFEYQVRYGGAIEAYTFGCPRVGDSKFAWNLRKRVAHYRFRHQNDLVPNIPTKMTVAGVQGTMWYQHGYKTFVRLLDRIQPVISCPMTSYNEDSFSGPDHSCPKYIASISRLLNGPDTI